VPPTPHETCWTVVLAAATGNAAAKSTFSRSYAPVIRRYLEHCWRSSPHRHEIDDALQDVFVECLKSGGVLAQADPGRGDFRGLLYGVVRNIARRFEERAAIKHRRHPSESVRLDNLPDQADALSRVFDRAWARALLKEAVIRHATEARAQDADYRRRYRILRMRHHQGLPIREIAARLGEADIDKVHNDYRRARREFRGLLREVVAAHTGVRDAAVDAECRRLTEILGS
jgi:RNA polymerase sigma factor (sigma-70 family)